MGRADPSQRLTFDRDDAAEFAQLGAHVPEDWISEGTDDSMPIWEEHWPAITAFLAVETQWRFASTMAGLHRTGLDYAALDVVMRRRSCADHVFDEIRLIEQGALDAFAEVEASR